MKRFVSFLLILEGLLLLLCFPIALMLHEQVWPVVIPSIIALLGGVLSYIFSGTSTKIPSNKENIILILLVWIIVIAIGTIPFLLTGNLNSFIDVLFETVSGFTATGTSILPNPGVLPKSILFWRSLTQWYGGFLTISMLLVIFPEINIGGYKLFSIDADKKFLVIRVFFIYSVLTLMQVLLLSIGGINPFKSFCISFATISSGCFLPDQTSIADYSSYLQFILAGFMFLSGLGGLFYYKLFMLKKLKFWKHEEFSLYIYSFLIITILFTWILLHTQSIHNQGATFTKSIFQAASFISSSGYEIFEFRLWPHYFQPLLYLLIAIGGCTNSTGGGIKLPRFIVLFKNIRTQFKNPMGTTNGSGILLNGNKIDEETNLNILAFVSVFGLVIVLGTLALTFIISDIKESVFLTITALSTFGHHFDVSVLPVAGKIVLTFLMLLGRLEIFPILVFLVPSFYKKSSL